MDNLSKAVAGTISKEEQVAAIEDAGRLYYYTAEQIFDDKIKKMVIDEMRSFIQPGHALELGYTNDIWTRALLERAERVTIVEAASNHVEQAKRDFVGQRRVTV